MATHHWIIICGIKHHVQVGITAGCGRVDRVKEMRMVMMVVMLMKTITVAMMASPGYSSMATGDDGPLRQGAGEGVD